MHDMRQKPDDTLIAACVQMASGDNMDANIEKARGFIAEAVKQNAQLIALPEHVALRVSSDNEWAEKSDFTQDTHPAVQAFQETASEHSVWLLVGSVAVREPGQERFSNRSILINDKGQIAATYDKMTLFDMDLTAQGGKKYEESKTFQPGDSPVVAETPWGLIGMTICADIRTPEIYNALARAGADIITVPAAFTYQTGTAGVWKEKLEERFAETQAYILAPGMVDPPGVEPSLYGHSMILGELSPEQGGIMKEMDGEQEGIITEALNIKALRECRNLALTEEGASMTATRISMLGSTRAAVRQNTPFAR